MTICLNRYDFGLKSNCILAFFFVLVESRYTRKVGIISEKKLKIKKKYILYYLTF